MIAARRPSVPWHAPATRRLSLLRGGLPTLVACLLAVGPGAAVQAQSVVPPQAAALVRNATTAARDMLDPPPGGQGGQGGQGGGGDFGPPGDQQMAQ